MALAEADHEARIRNYVERLNNKEVSAETVIGECDALKAAL